MKNTNAILAVTLAHCRAASNWFGDLLRKFLRLRECGPVRHGNAVVAFVLSAILLGLYFTPLGFGQTSPSGRDSSSGTRTRKEIIEDFATAVGPAAFAWTNSVESTNIESFPMVGRRFRRSFAPLDSTGPSPPDERPYYRLYSDGTFSIDIPDQQQKSSSRSVFDNKWFSFHVSQERDVEKKLMTFLNFSKELKKHGITHYPMSLGTIKPLPRDLLYPETTYIKPTYLRFSTAITTNAEIKLLIESQEGMFSNRENSADFDKLTILTEGEVESLVKLHEAMPGYSWFCWKKRPAGK